MKIWMCASVLAAMVAAGPALAASKTQKLSDIEQRERQVTAQLNEQQVQHPGTTAPMTGSSGSSSSGGAMSPDMNNNPASTTGKTGN